MADWAGVVGKLRRLAKLGGKGVKEAGAFMRDESAIAGAAAPHGNPLRAPLSKGAGSFLAHGPIKPPMSPKLAGFKSPAAYTFRAGRPGLAAASTSTASAPFGVRPVSMGASGMKQAPMAVGLGTKLRAEGMKFARSRGRKMLGIAALGGVYGAAVGSEFKNRKRRPTY